MSVDALRGRTAVREDRIMDPLKLSWKAGDAEEKTADGWTAGGVGAPRVASGQALTGVAFGI